MNNILQLQSDYLNGNDKALDQLYLELVKLGKTIIRCESLRLETDAAYDMATSVVMRLTSLREPIINTSPSAFVKRALFYTAHNIQKNHNNQCVEYPASCSTTDTYFSDEVCDDLILEILTNVDIPEDLMQMVSYCLYTQQSVKAVRVRIRDREDKKRFTQVMEKINEYIHQKDVCVSMLQWNSNGRPQVLPKTPKQRTSRKRTDAQGQVVPSNSGEPQPLLFSEMETTESNAAKGGATVCKVRRASNGSPSHNPTPWLPGIVLRPTEPSQPMP